MKVLYYSKNIVKQHYINKFNRVTCGQFMLLFFFSDKHPDLHPVSDVAFIQQLNKNTILSKLSY